MRSGILLSLLLGAASLLTVSCKEEPAYDNDLYGNFDALAHIIDTKYCFFEAKDVDWDAVTAKYRGRITNGMTVLEFFNLCAEMLDELKDGHVNLTSYFTSSYYRKWWSDYPQDFNLRTLQQYYLDFDYMQTSGISYKMFDGGIGYMYYPSFSSGIGEFSLDNVMAYLYDAKALILDIRDNGGGLLTNIDVLVSRFIEQEIVGGYIVHKEGPGHNDFSEPFEFTYSPAPEYRVKWKDRKPIFLLTNRSCFSAANDFVAVMKTLPNVTVIGARTGGGGGLPFTSEIPCGWSVRFSACPIYAPDGSITEFGIDPSEGYEMHCTPEELASGYDAILELALSKAREVKDPGEQ